MHSLCRLQVLSCKHLNVTHWYNMFQLEKGGQNLSGLAIAYELFFFCHAQRFMEILTSF